MSIDIKNKYVAKGSDKNHVTWIEYNGKRICTMKESENDWDMCKLIETSLNNHDKLIERLKKVNEEYNYALKIIAAAGGFTYSENAFSIETKQLLKSIEQDQNK